MKRGGASLLVEICVLPGCCNRQLADGLTSAEGADLNDHEMHARDASPAQALWRGAALALVLAALAAALRHGAGYPRCLNDEINWSTIAGQLDRGVDWPVSGPLFVDALRGLAALTGAPYPLVLSWMGVLGVFVGAGLLLWSYRRLAWAALPATMVALALTSYFWAPLLEARPQQWGQVLVLAGAVSCWRWLTHRGGWLFFALLALTALTHILSHVVLACICAVLALADWLEGGRFGRRHRLVWGALLASALVYVWPAGPYAPMLQDLKVHHVPRLLAAAPQLLGAALALSGLTFAARQHWHRDPHRGRALALCLARHRRAAVLAAALLLVTALSLQAWILPDAAWGPYGGSVWRFVVLQGGNALFLLSFLLGAPLLFGHSSATGEAAHSRRMLRWALAALALLGLAALAGSLRSLDTNWLLRLVNYGVLFAAPVAGAGLAWMHRRGFPAALLWVLAGAAVLVSMVAVVRPAPLVGC